MINRQAFRVWEPAAVGRVRNFKDIHNLPKFNHPQYVLPRAACLQPPPAYPPPHAAQSRGPFTNVPARPSPPAGPWRVPHSTKLWPSLEQFQNPMQQTNIRPKAFKNKLYILSDCISPNENNKGAWWHVHVLYGFEIIVSCYSSTLRFSLDICIFTYSSF